MSLSNTTNAYGSLSKLFHWSIAGLILVLIPLGIVANGLPADTSEQIARKAALFSVHKTLGVLVFFLALLRISWAIVQPKPFHLHPNRKGETFLATTAHWLLYGSLILVPLSGWLHHAATTGFAPIWWPFGQSLPFVPKDPELAEVFAGLHIVFERVLVFTLLAHIAGALKHHFWDRDTTLLRMLPGTAPTIEKPAEGQPSAPRWQGPGAAIVVFALAVGLGGFLGVYGKHQVIAAEAPLVESAETGWSVSEGDIAIAIRQMGAEVSGSFAEWTASIEFSEMAVDGRHGTVDVTVSIPSLSLGSVTGQAMGGDYFDATTYPTAQFSAVLLPEEGENTYRAEGTLAIKGTEIAVSEPFSLVIEGDTGSATLSLTVDRRDFGIGLGQTDEGTLGFSVEIQAQIVATRVTG